MDYRHREPEPRPEAAAPPSVAAGLWLGCRFTHQLSPVPGDPPGRPRLVEVDVVATTSAAWAASTERRAGDWAVHEDAGMVIAERIVG